MRTKHLSIYPSIYVAVRLPVHVLISLPTYRPFDLSICLPVYLATWLCPCVYLSTCLPIYLSIHLRMRMRTHVEEL